MRQLFYYKMRQKFIAKCARFFITKRDSFITKCSSYCKTRRFYYKIRRLLQIPLVQCGLKIITFGPISETFYAVTYLELIRKVLRNNKQ